MLPGELSAEHFRSYPPQAEQIAKDHLQLLRALPLGLLAGLLEELIAYDWKFPAERRELDNQLSFLSSLPSDQLRLAVAPFAKLGLTPELEQLDWVNSPAQFVERFSAHLWATHQIDGFRAAAVEYMEKVSAQAEPGALPIPRLAIVVVGGGVKETTYRLFRRLRPHGTYFTHVNADGGWPTLRDAVAERAAAHPAPYGHWYVDGGNRAAHAASGLVSLSWGSLASLRERLLDRIRRAKQTGAGSEEVRSMLARMDPGEAGFHQPEDDPILSRFQVSLLTEGSGTQLFSTTFVQWAVREVFRRAQPLTLLARFAPRERELSLGELLSMPRKEGMPDPQGSLIDADMGAYYAWLSQQRLSHSTDSRFLVWFEDHSEALAVAPRIPAKSVSDGRIDMRELLERIS